MSSLGWKAALISNLVLSAISIKNATTESMNLAKKSLGGEVSLSMNMEKLLHRHHLFVNLM